MKVTKILILFIIIIFSKSVRSQDTVSVFTFPVSSTIGYDPIGSPENTFNNAVLREIAVNEVRSLKNTRLIVDARLKIYLLRSGDLDYLKISADPVNLSGDNRYRKFSFSGVMKPSAVRLTLQFRSVQDSLIIRELKDLSVGLKKNDSIPVAGLIEKSDENSLWLTAENIRFFYDETDLGRFHQRQKLIDDYYASAAIADSLEPVMKSMDYKITGLYPLYLIRMEEISKIEQLIRQRDFEDQLDLAENDPKDLSRKSQQMLRFSKSFAMTFESVLDTLPVLNTTLPEKVLINKYLDMIERYVRWSFLINERNGIIYREFLDRFYEMNAFEDDEKAVIRLIRTTYPGLNAASIYRDLLRELKMAYEQKASACTEVSRFAEAVDLLDHLRRLENKYPFLKDSIARKDSRYTAAYGIYSSYLGVAENSLNIEKPRIAKWYLDKALKYANASKGLIRPDTLYERVLYAYHVASLASCDAIYKDGDYTRSVECYNEFLAGLDSLSGSILNKEVEERIALAREGMVGQMLKEAKNLAVRDKPDSALLVFDQAVAAKKQIRMPVKPVPAVDSLRPVIDRYRYGKLIREAEENCMRMQYTKAWELLEQAGRIAGDLNFPIDQSLDSLRHRIYPKYIEEQFAMARPLIWSNRFEKAGHFADSVENILKENGTIRDPETAAAVAGFRKKIRDRVCWYASDRMNVLILRSQRYVLSRNYITALSLLDSALVIAGTNPGCILESGPVRDTVEKYSPAGIYQEMAQKVDGNISLGYYEGFREQYSDLEKYYTKNHLDRYGLVCLPVFDYVEGKSREGLTLEVLSTCLKNNDPAEAFYYLKLLYKQGYSRNDAGEIMKSLGAEMAQKDKRSDPASDPLVMAERYTGGDEWFRIFTDYYKKEWKKKGR